MNNQLIKKKILITGSKGFISSNLIQYLSNKDVEIYATSKDIGSKYFFDLSLKVNHKTLPRFDILIHLAYQRSNTYFKERKINFEGSKKIFEIAKRNRAKIIYLSSQSADSQSSSNYGKIKFAIEKLALTYNANILKPGLIYKENAKNGIYAHIEALVKKSPVIIFPYGLNKKIYVNNIKLIIKKIENIIHNQTIKSIDYLDENNKYNLKELIEMISKNLHRKILIIPIHYKVIFCILKILEIFGFKYTLRSDSLKSLIN